MPQLVGWRWTSATSTRFLNFFYLSLKNCARRPLWRSAVNIFDLWLKVWRGEEQGVVAPLLRREGPRRCYGPLRKVGLCSMAQQFEWKTGEHCQCLTTGSAFAMMMTSPARGLKGGNTVDGQLRGDWRLSISWREEAWGSLVVRPRPLERSSRRCSLPSYSDFLHHSALRGYVVVLMLLLPFHPCTSFWSCWTTIAYFDIPAAESHGHTHLPPS